MVMKNYGGHRICNKTITKMNTGKSKTPKKSIKQQGIEEKKENQKGRGRPKNLTPETMLEHFNQYVKETKANPIIVTDWVGAKAVEVRRMKERPLTMQGYEVYCFKNDIARNLGDYFSNKDGKYVEFSTICAYIRRTIADDQIGGGMAGIYNPSITQRLNNLTDKVEQTQIVHTINLAG